jgi:DNA-binding GntR family transcriptional regulator
VGQHPGRKPPAKYRQIADDLRDRIEIGEYPVDAQLPTKAELMKQYSASLATVDHAIDVLRDWGLVETRQGVGTFARRPPAPEELPPEAARRRLEQMAADLRELQEQVGVLQAQMMDVYARSGWSYPYEDAAAQRSKPRLAT